MALDIDWVREQFPAFAEPSLQGQAFFENAGGSYTARPVIERLQRFSRPGLRRYCGKSDLPTVLGGLGVAIVTTSRGVMTDRQARAEGVGGEVVCVVA